MPSSTDWHELIPEHSRWSFRHRKYCLVPGPSAAALGAPVLAPEPETDWHWPQRSICVPVLHLVKAWMLQLGGHSDLEVFRVTVRAIRVTCRVTGR